MPGSQKLFYVLENHIGFLAMPLTFNLYQYSIPSSRGRIWLCPLQSTTHFLSLRLLARTKILVLILVLKLRRQHNLGSFFMLLSFKSISTFLMRLIHFAIHSSNQWDNWSRMNILSSLHTLTTSNKSLDEGERNTNVAESPTRTPEAETFFAESVAEKNCREKVSSWGRSKKKLPPLSMNLLMLWKTRVHFFL